MTDAIALPAMNQLSPAMLNAVAFLASFENPRTRESYEIDLRLYFAWLLRHNLDPLHAKRAHLQAYIVYLREERGNSPATICRRLASVAGYYDCAVVDNLLEHSPAHHLKLPKIRRDDVQRVWLNRFEMGALVKAARDTSPLDWVTVHLLGTMGMRVGAVCQIRIEDFRDSADGYRVLRSEGKGGVISHKAIPVPVGLAINALQADRPDGPLLLRRNGKPANRASIDRALKRLANTAGIDKTITPHTLRRSNATILLKAGVDPRLVQEGLDHKSMKTTQIYNQLGVEFHAQAAHTMAALVASAS